jgi:hypothetical protein
MKYIYMTKVNAICNQLNSYKTYTLTIEYYHFCTFCSKINQLVKKLGCVWKKVSNSTQRINDYSVENKHDLTDSIDILHAIMSRCKPHDYIWSHNPQSRLKSNPRKLKDV